MTTRTRNRWLLVALLGLAPLLSGHAARAQSSKDPDITPIGIWRTIDDKTNKPRSHVQIWESKGVLYGKIVKLYREPGEDQNPLCDKCEGANHNKQVIGMVVIAGLKRDGTEWNGGSVLDPESGNTYRCLIEPLNGGKQLKVRGYIGFSLLGRTQIWQRVK